MSIMKRSLAGPRDNNNYRLNVSENKETTKDAITYEGILNEYSFSDKEEPDLLFNTFFSSAISKNIETEEKEYYLSLQMMSKLDGEGLQRHGGRPPMNFSFVLDISGSMDSKLDRDSKSKLDVAKECLINLVSRLSSKDKFGLILFNTEASTLIPMATVESLNLANAKQQILQVRTNGGTSVYAGLVAAEKMLVETTGQNEGSTSNNNLNRIMFLTDLNPSAREEQQIIDFANQTAKKRIFISMIGIGFDFNSGLSYKLAKVKGCNSFGVISADQFRKQMITDFNHNSLMIVYDVVVKMESTEFEVVEIYGSPAEPDKSKGEVLKIDSVCPSAASEEGIKGGVVVLKLKRKNPEHSTGDKLSLKLSYNDWNDSPFEKVTEFTFPDDPKNQDDLFEDVAIRKAIALIRYVSIVKRVLGDKKAPNNKETLEKCKSFLVSEMQALNDKTLDKEVLMLDTLIAKNS